MPPGGRIGHGTSTATWPSSDPTGREHPGLSVATSSREGSALGGAPVQSAVGALLFGRRRPLNGALAIDAASKQLPSLSRHRAHRRTHAGEPVVRPLLRHALRRGGFFHAGVLAQRVRGKRYPVWDQFGYAAGRGRRPNGYLQPFHLLSDPHRRRRQTTNDISHNWGPQHQSWNHGADGRLRQAHLAADGLPTGSRDHGLLHAGRPAVLLRARRRLHDL